MRFLECQQGTPEWLAARAGLCTASEFATACSTVGALTEQQKKYVDAVIVGCMTEKAAAEFAGYKAVPKAACIEKALRGEPTEEMSDSALRYAHDLAIERISGKPYGQPVKTWLLERGHEREAIARRHYEVRHSARMTTAGLCVDDDGLFGYSTDGLIGERGLWECKAPIDSVKIFTIWRTGDIAEYMHQMQGGIWLTGRDWCDFTMYCEELENAGPEGHHLYVQRVHRDDAFIDAMVPRLARFQAKVEELIKFIQGA